MSIDIHQEKVLILDFGSQYTQLIAKRVRECRVYSEIRPFNIDIEEIESFNPKGIILSGGPSSVYDETAPFCSRDIFQLDFPILGICYGMQFMAHILGGEVEAWPRREYGQTKLEVNDFSDLFAGFESSPKIDVWMSHGDRIQVLPPGFAPIAHSENSPIAAIKDNKSTIFGVQFHPEVAHTPRGMDILKNFLYGICGCLPHWTMESFVESSVSEVRKKVGGKRVICALSGGVDSSVVAVLLHRAVGDQLVCVFVNNGLLRKNESREVRAVFGQHYKTNLRYIDAEEIFLEKLRGVTDPEMKRRIIGNEFIHVFEKEAENIGDVEYLAQGTLYPDVIESISFKGPSATIKSHHNVGGLPEKMNLKLIEPLRELFKDEVRLVGRELGLPEEIIDRQPFPGPGLAVRILGEVTKEDLSILRDADSIVSEEIEKTHLKSEIWQSFAVLLPIKTVGVMGDERTYENVVALRVVRSVDGMTADWVKLPYEVLGRMANRIINEVKGVNRVVYDISSKPPST
ncbi:MAG: glutamine-hydrolyzing GMP synthase, partial [Pseudomonadota bacterium]